jgi:hypothetical protein
MYETLSLNPGLVALRFIRQSGGVPHNAVIRPVVLPEYEDDVVILFDPAAQDDTLTHPGDLCILRCARVVTVGLEITSRQPGVAPRGSIEVEYLTRAAKPSMAPARGAGRGAPPPHDLHAHFSMVGDRYARFGDWLEADAPSEGIEGLTLAANPALPRILMRDRESGQIAGPGEFLGTKGRFRPLTDIEVWIDGGPVSHLLQVEAQFRNAGRVTQGGAFLSLRGLGDDERLLGLNLRVVERTQPAASAQPPSPPAPPPAPAPPAGDRPERVKIFRK